MKELKDFTVNLKNGRNSFCGGEVMRGQIFVTFEEAAEMQNIKIRFFGEAFSQTENVHGSNNKLKNRKKESVVDLQKVLFGNAEGTVAESVPTHPFGSYRYDFDFIVPRYLPCSFESPKDREWGLAYIRYYIEATITRPWRPNFTKLIPVNVNEVIDTTLPEYSYRPGCQTQKELGMCLSDGILSIEAYLNEICYNQGDIILISCEAENDSNRIMTSVYAKLFRRTRYRRKKETKTHLDVVAEYYGDRVLPKQSVSWKDLEFKIPVIGPTITKSNRINVDYFLRVGMYQQFRDEIHVDLPIVIGTTKQYLLEKRLLEDGLQQDVSVTIDPVASRESLLSNVDRQKLEDIADMFTRMPHAGKRPSVQYLNALVRKNRRQQSEESTPHQTPRDDSDGSLIGEERAHISQSADLLHSSYYDDPAYLSPNGLSSRRASETNLYQVVKSNRQRGDISDGINSRPTSTTPTPRNSFAGILSKGNTPRPNDKTGPQSARPSVRKAASHSNIGLNRASSADEPGRGLSPRKSPAAQPTFRKTASQGKVDMKEAALIAAGLGNVRRKGGMKIKGQKSEGNAIDLKRKGVAKDHTSATHSVATDQSQSPSLAKSTNDAMVDGDGTQKGLSIPDAKQGGSKQTPSASRLKGTLKKPIMSPIHSAAESGTESPCKVPKQDGKEASSAKQSMGLSQTANARKASSSNNQGNQSAQKQNLLRSKSKIAAMIAFKKGSKASNNSAVNSTKANNHTNESNMKDRNRKMSLSLKGDTTKNQKINSKDEKMNAQQEDSPSEKSLGNAASKNKTTVNDDTGELVEDDVIAPINERIVEQTPDFDLEAAFAANDQMGAKAMNQQEAEVERQNEAENDREAIDVNHCETATSRETEDDICKDGSASKDNSKIQGKTDVVEENDLVAAVRDDDLEEAPSFNFDNLDYNEEPTAAHSGKFLISEEGIAANENGRLERALSLDEFEQFEAEIFGNSHANGNGNQESLVLKTDESYEASTMNSVHKECINNVSGASNVIESNKEFPDGGSMEDKDNSSQTLATFDTSSQSETFASGTKSKNSTIAKTSKSNAEMANGKSGISKDQLMNNSKVSPITASNKRRISKTELASTDTNEASTGQSSSTQKKAMATASNERQMSKTEAAPTDTNEESRIHSSSNRKSSKTAALNQRRMSKTETASTDSNEDTKDQSSRNQTSSMATASNERRMSKTETASNDFSKVSDNHSTSNGIEAKATSSNKSQMSGSKAASNSVENSLQDIGGSAGTDDSAGAGLKKESLATRSRKESVTLGSRKQSITRATDSKERRVNETAGNSNSTNLPRNDSITKVGNSDLTKVESSLAKDGLATDASKRASVTSDSKSSTNTARKISETAPRSIRKTSNELLKSEEHISRMENGFASNGGDIGDDQASFNGDKAMEVFHDLTEERNEIDVQEDKEDMQGKTLTDVMASSVNGHSSNGQVRVINDEYLDQNENKEKKEKQILAKMSWRKSLAKIRSVPIANSSRRRSIVSIKVVNDEKQ